MKNDRNHGKGDSGERRRKALGCFPISSNPLRKSGAQAGQGVFLRLMYPIHPFHGDESIHCMRPKAPRNHQYLTNREFRFFFVYFLNPIWQRSKSGANLRSLPSLFDFNLSAIGAHKDRQLVGLQPRPKFTFSLTR